MDSELSAAPPSKRLLFTGLLPFFVIAHFVHHLLTSITVPLLPMIRSDFGLDYTQSGLVISAFNLAYGFGQLPAGLLADRIGPRILITVGICGVALAGFFVGVVQTFPLMIFFLALMGVLGGGYHPASPPLISSFVEPRMQGQALGLHVIGGGASYFLAPLIATAIALVFGWRGSFVSLAIPTAIFGIFFYILLGRRSSSTPRATKAKAAVQETPFVPGQARNLVIFIFLSTFTGAVIYSTISFIPLYLVDYFAFSKAKAGAWYSFLYSAGLWVGPIGGYLSDRWGRIPVILLVCFLTGPVIYSFHLAPGPVSIICLLLLIGIIIYVRMPVSESYIVKKTSPHNRSTIFGLYFFGSMEGGGILTPVVGHLIDHYGFATSFTIAGAVLVGVTLVCGFFLWGSRD